MARCTRCSHKVCQWLATGRWFSQGTLVTPPIKLPRYNWNIVESGIKYHKPTNQICVLLDIQCIYFILLYNICLTARILVSKSEWLGILDQICHKMKNKKYHSVGIIPKSNKITIETEENLIHCTTYITIHFPGLVQALQ
jgi:hypothetical protein